MAEAQTATPQELLYSNLPPMATPSANLLNVKLIPSTGNTYGPNSNCRIPINVPTDSFVDFSRSYLKLSVKNNTTGGDATQDRHLYLDPQGGISCAIDRLEFISGTGSVLSSTHHYNAYCAMMNTHMMDDYVRTTLNLTEGCSSAPVATQSFAADGADDAGLLSSREAVEDNTTRSFVHRPKDPVFTSNRLMPIGYLSGIPYVSINFASANGAFRVSKPGSAANVPAWEIKDVELHLAVIQVPTDFAQSFRSLMNSGVPISMASTAVVNAQQNLAQGSATGTSTFSVRKRNVKGFLLMARAQTDLENKDADSSSCRRSLSITEYNYGIGGQRLPSYPLQVSTSNTGLLLMETKKALGHLSSLHGICAQKDNYYVSDEIDGSDANKNKSLCQKSIYALDTQQYTDSSVMSGINLSAQGLPVTFEFTADNTKGAQKNDNILFDLYTIHQVLFVCDGISGTISASS